MSMLAEPRRKQKWSLNARGKQWSEDSSKFGQRILEKMGWSSGKGLGANEQGITEHVHVSMKNDMTGIGFKKSDLDEMWREHQEDFNDFLQKLQQDTDSIITQAKNEYESEMNGRSLEIRSKQSRARVHYQKFTRGKDINKYSPKDLANIFGKKELNASKTEENGEENIKENSDSVNKSGVIVINGGNMIDYFSKKGQNISEKSKRKETQKMDKSSSEFEHADLAFSTIPGENNIEDACNYAFENPCVQLNTPENSPTLSTEASSSKKRKHSDRVEISFINKGKKFKQSGVNDIECKQSFVNAALNLDNQTEDVYNGKEFEVSRVQFGVTNTALDLSDEEKDKKRVRFNDQVEYSTDSAKKKKSRSMLDKFEVENKKAKKRRKLNLNDSNKVSLGFINEALDVDKILEETHDNEINERKSKKSKRRKESRLSNLETIVEIPEEDAKETYDNEAGITENKAEESEHISSKKKKKKKRKEKTEESSEIKSSIEEILENRTLEIEKSEEEICEIKEDEGNTSKKNKKKRKSKDKESVSVKLEFDENIVSENKVEVHTLRPVKEDEEGKAESVEVVKRKKKKSKKSKRENADDCNSADVNLEQGEMSDKENADTNGTEIRNDEDIYDEEGVDDFVMEEDAAENYTPSESGRFSDSSSPWNRTARMKKIFLKSLFRRNCISNFPGANINKIPGYGADERNMNEYDSNSPGMDRYQVHISKIRGYHTKKNINHNN